MLAGVGAVVKVYRIISPHFNHRFQDHIFVCIFSQYETMSGHQEAHGVRGISNKPITLTDVAVDA